MPRVGEGTFFVEPALSPDRIIAAMMREQHGRVARSQLLAAGVASCVLDWQLRQGALIAEHAGVYVAPGCPPVPLGEETGAVLACGADAMLADHSAITLWELRPGTARPIHVLVPRGTHHRRHEGVVVHRSAILTPEDRRVHRGLPVTSPARALLDVAARLSDDDVERLVAVAIFRRITTRAELIALLDRAGGHPGRARLERVLHARKSPARTESNPERRLLELIRAAGLPEPETQAWMLGYRLDFLWREHGLAVEVDAFGTHGDARRFEHDRRRDARLLAEAGITVVRITDRRIAGDAFAVVAELTRLTTVRPRNSGVQGSF